LSGGAGDNGEPRFGGGLDVEVDGSDFENVIGSPFSDYIVGNSGGNKIYAGGGADVVLGGDGNDEIHGGADGDDLDGQGGSDSADGEAGADHCVAETQTSCGAAAGVVTRDATKVEVGQMTPGVSRPADVYLAGSNIADNVSAAYTAGSPATVTFTVTSGSATFDTAAAAAGGCAFPTSTQAVCTLAGPLDALVLFGGAGADHLDAPGFPSSASVVLAGGTGSDTLGGGDLSEDVLVDDPGTAGGTDHLAGLGRDDALLNNEGADHVDGGGGNDLVLSSSICDGDQLAGGPQRDNAAYPRLDVAVEANLVTGLAGHPGGGSTPVCAGAGEQLDSLTGFEDVEGSDHADAFFGDAGPNNLLGWGSDDLLRGGGGDDRLFANAGDNDRQVLCGDGLDRVLLDRPPSTDSAADDCEIVEQADPGTFAFTIDPLPEPAFSGTDPASPADDNSPSVLGTAQAGSTVRLYSSSDCAAPSLLATGSAAQFASPGIPISVADNSSTTLHAIARSANSASECSAASITYTESTPAPPSVDPTAVADFATVAEGSGPTSIDVLANDTDPDGGPKAVVSVTPAAQGAAAVSPGGGGVTYAPPGTWCGQDAFTYALNGGSSASVTVTVTCPPPPPPPPRQPNPPVRHCDGAVATRAGTPRGDVINGTSHRDVIAALGGNDLVRGLGGNDLICGGNGRDRLLGGAGRDLLLGGAGLDELLGGPGRDRQRQ
jgi:Ca2+-binding RTX toxin-like protein